MEVNRKQITDDCKQFGKPEPGAQDELRPAGTYPVM